MKTEIYTLHTPIFHNQTVLKGRKHLYERSVISVYIILLLLFMIHHLPLKSKIRKLYYVNDYELTITNLNNKKTYFEYFDL